MEHSPSDWSLNDGEDEVLYRIALQEEQAREVEGVRQQLQSVTLEDTKEQVGVSTEPRFKAEQILNQGIRRYNQMFSAQQTVTIAGDFTLHAGDAIYIDTPSIKTETDDEVNKETGGKYIIADLCHYVSPKQTFTKMNVVRDSFGRKAENAPVSSSTHHIFE